MTTIVKMLFGSHLYGMDTPESDRDYKGIFLPDRRDVLLQRVPRSYSESTGNDSSRNTAEDTDFECFSLHEFVRLACNGETVAIDMLHAKDEHIQAASEYLPIFQELRDLRTYFYGRDMKAYMGYVRKQAAKYGVKGSRLAVTKEVLELIKELSSVRFGEQEHRVGDIADYLPVNDHCRWVEPEDDKSSEKRRFYEVCGRKLQDTLPLDKAEEVVQKIVDGYGHRAKMAEQNEMIDWKAVSHALRAGYQLWDIYTKGDFEYPLDQTDYLLSVKRGERDFKSDVQPELEKLVDDVEKAAQQSSLPEKPSQTRWDEWLIEKMEEYVL